MQQIIKMTKEKKVIENNENIGELVEEVVESENDDKMSLTD